MRIIQLEIQDYMNIRAVRITPTGSIVKIEGRNRQGKSNVIDAIWAALGGDKAAGPDPIRDGAKGASITLSIDGGIVVQRKFSANGNTYLTVKHDGVVQGTPQTTLSKLYTEVSMDAGAFISMSPLERAAWLLSALGVKDQVRAIEGEIEDLFSARTDMNREVKGLKGRVRDKIIPTARVEVVDTATISDELEDAMGADREYMRLERLVEIATDHHDRAKRHAGLLAEEMVELEGRIAGQTGIIDSTAEDLGAEVANLARTERPDVDGIRTRLAESGQRNIDARSANLLIDTADELRKKTRAADDLTSMIAGLRESKLALVHSVDTGVKGFDMDDDNNIMIDGRNLDSMSTSEQLTTAMRLAMASNPMLRVIRVSRGESFDLNTMAELESWADANDVQIWVERVVDQPTDGAFHIEDGEVV